MVNNDRIVKICNFQYLPKKLWTFFKIILEGVEDWLRGMGAGEGKR
jgi:hypothetical protein